MTLPESTPRSRAVLPSLLAIAVVLTFLPSLGNGFVNWDDNVNLRDNPEYRGLGVEQLRWMWSTFLLGHYQPLSWMSLGLDYVFWGMNPLGYHLSSLLLHAANSVLLYWSLLALLRRRWPDAGPWSAFAGALFYGLHPLRVESVVWATERRDVLCGFFALLALLAYLKRAEEEQQGRPAARWLALSCAAFAASLLSKALGIMLPVVLLILDLYPLGRFARVSARRLILEKIPYGVLALADGLIMIQAMRHINQVRSGAGYVVSERVAQSAYGLCFYLLKTIWPSGLIPIYRIEVPLNPWSAKYLVSMAIVVGLTAALGYYRRRWPAGLTAWACYGILVFPVLGVVVTGFQIAADRYTYLAIIPLIVLASAGLERLLRREAPLRRAAAAAVAGVLILLATATVAQTRVWKDSITLWTQQLRVDPDCSLAYNSRGAERQDQGDWPGAVADCTKAIELDPESADPYLNRGLARARLGELDAALRDFDRLLVLHPRSSRGYQNRGVARLQKGDLDGALADLTRALEIGGDKPETYIARARVRGARGDMAGAIEDFEEALRRAPPDWSRRKETEMLLNVARRQLRGK